MPWLWNGQKLPTIPYSPVIGPMPLIYNTKPQAVKSDVSSKAKTQEKVTYKNAKDTVIYRYGGTNPGNLTPRKNRDESSGLSFSTVPKPGAAVTTINAINSTGVVYAVQDGATHVSVKPVGATITDWIEEGSGSIWTSAVKSVVIKWDGGN